MWEKPHAKPPCFQDFSDERAHAHRWGGRACPRKFCWPLVYFGNRPVRSEIDRIHIHARVTGSKIHSEPCSAS